MSKPASLTIEQICSRYGLERDFVKNLVARHILHVNRVDGTEHLEPESQTRIEVILKGLELGFTLDEITVILKTRFEDAA